MKVRVLGCSGAIAKGCRTTSFLIDDDVLIDAGTGVGDLSLSEMQAIDHVFLTHSHLDHITSLPLMVDAVAGERKRPLIIHALGQTIAALKTHIFNDVIWPDFSRIPSAARPLISFEEILSGQIVKIAGKTIEALPAVHTVPAVGYSVCAPDSGCWVFSGDTERNPTFWQRINQIPVRMLVIETAFSNRESDLARRSLHLSPLSLASELALIKEGRDYPIYITHTKPSQTELIMDEIGQIADGGLDGVGDASGTPSFSVAIARDIRWLCAGQQFEF